MVSKDKSKEKNPLVAKHHYTRLKVIMNFEHMQFTRHRRGQKSHMLWKKSVTDLTPIVE